MPKLPAYCSLVCPKLDALLDDYDKCSDSESEADDSDCDDSSYDDSETNEEETEVEESETEDYEEEEDEPKSCRRNICSAMMGLLRAYPVEAGRQGTIEYKKSSTKPVSQSGGGMVYAIQTSLPSETIQDDDKRSHPMAEIKPVDMLKTIFETKGISTAPVPFKSLPEGFFLDITKEMVASYNKAIMDAVRKNDLKTVRRMHKEGQNLQCSNAFGESLMHTVARLGYAEMMDFLLHEANISLRVMCDSGRNVMHDACWNTSPNFDCIKLILEEFPDLLMIADNRNHTPLSYSPKDAWGEWCSFLEQHPEILVPKELNVVT